MRFTPRRADWPLVIICTTLLIAIGLATMTVAESSARLHAIAAEAVADHRVR